MFSAVDVPPKVSRDSNELFFGDFDCECIYCGKECSGSYCSDICELSDKAPPQDTEMPPLPALVSGYSQSSTSSQCSTPESSPFSRPSKAGEQDVAVLDLGEPAAAALSRTSLNFDYSYELAAEEVSSCKTTPRSPSLEALDDVASANIILPASLGRTPTGDSLRLRRTPLQNPTQPRKASTNLLSPVLKPANSPNLRARPERAKSFKLMMPPKRESKQSGCGKPGCASTNGSEGRIAMVRRASAPLSAQRIARPAPSRGDSAIVSSSSDEEDSTGDASAASLHRGRSRKASQVAAADHRAKSRARIHKRSERRADSAHAPRDRGGASICLHKDQCITARPLSQSFKQVCTLHEADHEPKAIVNPGGQFYGRARPSTTSVLSGSSNNSSDELESNVLRLGSPADSPEDAVAAPLPHHRGRRNTGPAHPSEDSELQGRGRSRVRDRSASAFRSQSPHRALNRLRRSP